MAKFIIHNISDSTGETLNVVIRACLAQFPDTDVDVRVWPLVRTKDKVNDVLVGVAAAPGFVIYTIVDDHLCEKLVNGCKRLKVPHVDLLNPVLSQLGNYLGSQQSARPGSQHVMDSDYFSKIEALHYVLAHDDGQSMSDLEEADIILFGVSRTSKTPTCIYLANRGIKAANVPVVPGIPVPSEAIELQKPLKIGLTKDPRRLVQIRRQRMKIQGHEEESDYVDLQAVSAEIKEARKLYDEQGWPVIDVSRKSVEETAATILQFYDRRLDNG